MKKIQYYARTWALVALATLLLLTGCVPDEGTPILPGDTSYSDTVLGDSTNAPATAERTEPSDVATEPEDTITGPSSGSTTETTVESTTTPPSVSDEPAATVDPSKLPAYSGNPYVIVNNNTPSFSSAELTTVGYESYAELDYLGRCGVALASCGTEIMPGADEERGSISSVKPSGWIQAQYAGISGGYLWNRCHLIGWQLSAENANRQNLITGSRYMNVEGMLPFENMVADYIRETGNHVAFRVTPIFEGRNLVCSGVQMEAYSIEDHGAGICFNVYCYNVQPGIVIDYATGASSGPGGAGSETKAETTTEAPSDNVEATVWIPNSGTKYHSSSTCSNMKNPRKVSLAEAQRLGYTACKKCH